MLVGSVYRKLFAGRRSLQEQNKRLAKGIHSQALAKRICSSAEKASFGRHVPFSVVIQGLQVGTGSESAKLEESIQASMNPEH